MNEERLDELLDLALSTGALSQDATEEERAELELLLGAASTMNASAVAIALEAAATMPIARARFERFVAAEAASEPAPEVAQQAGPGWLGRLFGSMRPLAATGVAAVVVVLVVVAFIGSDLIVSDTSTALALEVDPGDYLQVDGVVTEVTEGENGPRIRLETEAGFIELELSDDTSVLQDDAPISIRDVHVGQQLAVTGLVNAERRVRAAILSVRAEEGDAPTKVKVDEAKNIGDSFVGEVILINFGSDLEPGSVMVRRPDGGVVTFEVEPEELANFVRSEGFGPGAEVRMTHAGEGRDEFVFAPLRPAVDRCEQPRGFTDRQGLETICGILLSQEGSALTLQTVDGVRTVHMVPDARIEVPRFSGVTRAEVLEADGAIGHAIQVMGHDRDGEFIVGFVIVGPEQNLPEPRDDRQPEDDRR